MEIIKQTHGASCNEGHLGGWAMGGDGGTYYPIMWQFLMERYNIKSVLDVGCGRGYASRFFKSLGCEVLGIDGSKAAQALTLLDDNEFILHDYVVQPLGMRNQGELFDLAWCCEFVEHVKEEYMPNYMKTFQSCNFVAMTFAGPGQDGHHHVNLQPQEYWVAKMNEYGFSFLQNETFDLRNKANEDRLERLKDPACPFFIPHFLERGLLFANQNKMIAT